MCVDIVKGTQFLDVAKFPKIVFRSEKVRMTGPKSFEISGTLDLHGVTRPLVLTGTYNGGYAGISQYGSRTLEWDSPRTALQAHRFRHGIWRACTGYNDGRG